MRSQHAGREGLGGRDWRVGRRIGGGRDAYEGKGEEDEDEHGVGCFNTSDDVLKHPTLPIKIAINR
jgi:hypothetical protein